MYIHCTTRASTPSLSIWINADLPTRQPRRPNFSILSDGVLVNAPKHSRVPSRAKPQETFWINALSRGVVRNPKRLTAPHISKSVVAYPPYRFFRFCNSSYARYYIGTNGVLEMQYLLYHFSTFIVTPFHERDWAVQSCGTQATIGARGYCRFLQRRGPAEIVAQNLDCVGEQGTWCPDHQFWVSGRGFPDFASGLAGSHKLSTVKFSFASPIGQALYDAHGKLIIGRNHNWWFADRKSGLDISEIFHSDPYWRCSSDLVFGNWWISVCNCVK